MVAEVAEVKVEQKVALLESSSEQELVDLKAG
jgi:hypothetical protein